MTDPESQQASIDIIVATRDRPEDLARLLPTVVAQTHREFRCLVVDQSEDPKPNAELLDNANDPRLEHVVHRAKGKSRALNLALSMTSAPAVAFTDDDCTLPNDWLEKALAALERLPRPGIVFGNVLPCPHDPAVDFIPSIEFPKYKLLCEPLVSSPGLLGMGANMIISRQVFDEAGMFDEDLGPGGTLKTGEDCEISYRALRHSRSLRCATASSWPTTPGSISCIGVLARSPPAWLETWW